MARHFDLFCMKMEDNIIPAIEGRFGMKLKEFQKAVYKNSLRGEDVFVCAPTGSGRTYCFAFLSEAFKLRDEQSSVTLVLVSPLSSLVVEQARRLQEI